MNAPASGARSSAPRSVFFTVDAEPDCPPFLWSWRGIEEGAPALLSLLDDLSIPATFFTTGDTASRYPGFVGEVVERGHELACHGQTHRPFDEMSPDDAEAEIRASSALLREHGPVTSFRAPYLRFPEAYLPILERHGFDVDSSLAKYKASYWRRREEGSLARIPASITSSWLRLPPWVRGPLVRRLRSPVVLFVHPWEFVDLRDAPIRWDCRAGTGGHALASVRSVLEALKDEGASFRLMRSYRRGASG